MSDSSQHARIATYIQHIIQVCRDNPTRIAVATANLKSLCDVMANYERSPRFYNDLFEEGSRPVVAVLPDPPMVVPSTAPDQEALLVDLEAMFHRKITTSVLKQIGTEVARHLGTKVPRNAVRKSSDLIAWFRANWPAIRRVIQDFNFPQHLVFVESHPARPPPPPPPPPANP
jgi:hypothetical protein